MMFLFSTSQVKKTMKNLTFGVKFYKKGSLSSAGHGNKGCIKFGGLINLHDKLIKRWRIKEIKRINSIVLSMKLEESVYIFFHIFSYFFIFFHFLLTYMCFIWYIYIYIYFWIERITLWLRKYLLQVELDSLDLTLV